MKSLLILSFLLLGLAGCRSIQSISLTQIPAKRDKMIQAETSRLIVFGFNFDNDYVDALVAQLKEACPTGQVRGILTKDEIINYIGYLAYRRQVSAQGYCIEPRRKVAGLETIFEANQETEQAR